MTIRSVTLLCLVAAAITLVMSLSGQFVFQALYDSDMQRETIGTIQNIYYPIVNVLHDGSLLLFFITLYSRQKAPTPQP